MNGVARIRRENGFPTLRELDPGLAHVARWEAALSLAVPWCCLAVYALAAAAAAANPWWWALAVLATVLLSFFTYGSVSHDLVHGNLGLSRAWNRRWLTAVELLCVRSGTAYQAAHLHHHARFPAEDDLEGAAAGMSLGRSILDGFTLQPRLWLWAVRRGGPLKRRIVAEGVACVCVVIGSLALLPWAAAPAVFVGLMVAGSWILPVMTSHLPHDAHAEGALHQTKRFRGGVFSLLAVEHLYHVEHHLYPQVPHHRWKALAEKLDPFFERAGVEAIRVGVGGAGGKRGGA